MIYSIAVPEPSDQRMQSLTSDGALIDKDIPLHWWEKTAKTAVLYEKTLHRHTNMS